MRCPLCARPVTRVEGGGLACGGGHRHSRTQLARAAGEQVDWSLRSAIRALEAESEVRRLLAGDGDGASEERARRAERDCRLLRRLATARTEGTPARVAACGPVSGAIRAVSQFLVAEVPLGDTLERIAALARATVADGAAVSIALLDEKEQLYTAVCVGALPPGMDELQYAHGEGPVIEAFRRREPVRIDDTTAPGAWPSFRRKAAEGGILSSLALPLVAAGEAYGTLNLYARSTQAFLHEDADAFPEFATQVAVVLANARAYWRAFELSEGLRQASETRWVIEQAKGIIMAINGCSSDGAFEILVRASQRENVKLREIARRIVQHHSDETTPPADAPA